MAVPCGLTSSATTRGRSCSSLKEILFFENPLRTNELIFMVTYPAFAPPSLLVWNGDALFLEKSLSFSCPTVYDFNPVGVSLRILILTRFVAVAVHAEDLHPA